MKICKSHHAILSINIFAAAAVMLISQTVGAWAVTGPTAAEYGVVLNLSGKQRMLT